MKKTIALVTAVITVTLLAGCSSGGSGGGSDAGSSGGGSGTGSSSAAPSTPTPTAAGQSKAEACRSLEGDLQSVSTGLQDQMAQIQSDPTAAVAKLQEFDGQLKAATDRVSNDEVHSTASTFEQSFAGLVAQIDTYAKDPQSADAAKLQESIASVQSSTEAMTALCG